MESGEIKKYYVWESGYRKGIPEIYLAETEEIIYFESGRLVSKTDLDSGALRLIEEREYFQFMNSQPKVDPYQEWENLLGNPPKESELKEINVIEESKSEEIKIEENPIKLILNKQKKKEKLSIDLSINIEIPDKKVMSLLEMMFDRDEVTQEIIKSVISSINVDNVVQEIESKIRSSIEHSYE